VIRKESVVLSKGQVEMALAWLQLPSAPTLPKPEKQQELSFFHRKPYEENCALTKVINISQQQALHSTPGP